MVEMALTLPILLLILVGAVEIGMYYNTYLTLVDATREAARYSANGSPASQDSSIDCSKTQDFFKKAACLTMQNLNGVAFDPVRDDIVVSLILIRNSTVFMRIVDSYPSNQSVVPISVLGTGGWSRCRSLPDTTNPTTDSAGCIPDETRLPNSVIEARLSQFGEPSPKSAYVLVEIYHVHRQFLGLIPPGLPILPQEVMMHAYSIMPVPAIAGIIPD
jgi:Flp pilus assembly protein TadG